MLNRFWSDEAGFIVSTELILIATILVIGMLVGLVSVRDQVVQELADVAEAISDIDQSYTYTGILGHTSETNGSDFLDLADDCDVQFGQQTITSACVSIRVDPLSGIGKEGGRMQVAHG